MRGFWVRAPGAHLRTAHLRKRHLLILFRGTSVSSHQHRLPCLRARHSITQSDCQPETPEPDRRLGAIRACAVCVSRRVQVIRLDIAPGVVERFCRWRLRRGARGRHRQPPTRARPGHPTGCRCSPPQCHPEPEVPRPPEGPWMRTADGRRHAGQSTSCAVPRDQPHSRHPADALAHLRETGLAANGRAISCRRRLPGLGHRETGAGLAPGRARLLCCPVRGVTGGSLAALCVRGWPRQS
jgi:hypothetical protein